MWDSLKWKGDALMMESKYWCGRIFDRAAGEQGINITWWACCCWGGEESGNLWKIWRSAPLWLWTNSESGRARETVGEEVRVMLGRDEGEMWANRRWGWWRWLRLRRRKVGCCSALGQPLPCWWGGSSSQLEPVVLWSRAAWSSRPRWPAGGQLATWTRWRTAGDSGRSWSRWARTGWCPATASAALAAAALHQNTQPASYAGK